MCTELCCAVCVLLNGISALFNCVSEFVSLSALFSCMCTALITFSVFTVAILSFRSVFYFCLSVFFFFLFFTLSFPLYCTLFFFLYFSSSLLTSFSIPLTLYRDFWPFICSEFLQCVFTRILSLVGLCVCVVMKIICS